MAEIGAKLGCDLMKVPVKGTFFLVVNCCNSPRLGKKTGFMLVPFSGGSALFDT